MAGSKNLWIEVPPSVAHANTTVLLTGDRFPDVFWDNVLATGEDIIVYDNAGNKLPRQLVAINTGAKTMELYVKSPSSATEKTFLRMNYDDAGGAEVNDFADYEDYHETYSARVAASADNCRVYYTGSAWTLDTSTIYVGYASASVLKIGSGMRFLALNLAKNSHVCNANILFTSRANLANDTIKTYFTGELTGTPATFSTIANYQARRGTAAGGGDDTQRTVLQVAWEFTTDWATDSTYQSPELKSIVQEQVDTNALIDLGMFFDDHDARGTQSSNVSRSGYAYSGSAAKAPLLTVNYIPKLAYAVYTNDPITRTNVPRIARIILAMHG